MTQYIEDWNEFIQLALFAYRTMQHNTTKYKPFYLVYRREAQLPIKLNVPTYPTEKIREEEAQLVILNRIVTIIDHLKEARALALGNIKRSQEKQKINHDNQYTLHSFSIRDKACDETVIVDRDQVILRTSIQEIAEFMTLLERKTMAKKIRKNLNIYLQDLDCEEPTDFNLTPEVPAGSWDEKLTYVCQEILNLNIQGKLNTYILEAYYQVGSVLMEKRWSNVSRKKFNSYFSQAKGKAVWRIAKRVYQLFSARGEKYLYLVEHISITVLAKNV
ncbi:hypothetical protein C2G38_2222438 [Gigaspora rosea]|uniref:Uncharacterized protein n=1 Tax=Gigaspora rosea TaxID=44941 RepID=A0A397U6P3_9GLOM|nr:hypothetical protein C2G38_2222438 [Gigaspora rosea]